MSLDTTYIKKEFPLFSQPENAGLAYLDNAATAHKPQQVLDAIIDYYTQSNANIHRGVHRLSDASTLAWKEARQTISQFFGAKPQELIITRNTTESLNGVAYGWADHTLQEGDVILTSPQEHHSNLVVWQQVAKRTGVTIEMVKLQKDGSLNIDDLVEKLKTMPVRLLTLTWVSNTLGVVNPLQEIVQHVRSMPANEQPKICIDAAQAVPHLPVNFAQLDVDFLAFSGHKMYGPMGSGGLLVKQQLIISEEIKPWLFGGGMIAEVSPQQAVFHPDPIERFTPGTPDVASAVGLAAACIYLSTIGMEEVLQHDLDLINYSLQQLSSISQVNVVGPTNQQDLDNLTRVGSVAFTYQGVHPHDVAQVLDSEGVAVRSGHHCTMPLHQHFNWQATVRVSFGIYNSQQDINKLVVALRKVAKVFSV